MRRSMLFVPGNNPKMMTSCGFFGADAIIFDLEDAVSPDEKDAARLLVKYAVKNVERCRSEIIVRVNAADTPLFAQDLEAIVPQRPDYVRALFLGAEDLSADLHCSRTKEGLEILYARTRLVTAAHAAGVGVYDTPFTDVNDDEGIEADSRLARSLGFTGKASISPRHLDAINRCFSPSQAETDYAREVLAAIEDAKRCGKGAVALRGKMIDAPIAARARQTLAAAEEILAEGGTLQ